MTGAVFSVVTMSAIHGSQISHHRLRTLYKAPTACKYNVLRLCAGPARQQRYRVSMFSLKCDVKREVTEGLSEISNEIPFHQISCILP